MIHLFLELMCLKRIEVEFFIVFYFTYVIDVCSIIFWSINLLLVV